MRRIGKRDEYRFVIWIRLLTQFAACAGDMKSRLCHRGKGWCYAGERNELNHTEWLRLISQWQGEMRHEMYAIVNLLVLSIMKNSEAIVKK